MSRGTPSGSQGDPLPSHDVPTRRSSDHGGGSSGSNFVVVDDSRSLVFRGWSGPVYAPSAGPRGSGHRRWALVRRRLIHPLGECPPPFRHGLSGVLSHLEGWSWTTPGPTWCVCPFLVSLAFVPVTSGRDDGRTQTVWVSKSKAGGPVSGPEEWSGTRFGPSSTRGRDIAPYYRSAYEPSLWWSRGAAHPCRPRWFVPTGSRGGVGKEVAWDGVGGRYAFRTGHVGRQPHPDTLLRPSVLSPR